MGDIDWVAVVIIVVALVIIARIVYVTLWLTGRVDDTKRYNKTLERRVQKKAKKFDKERKKLVERHKKRGEHDS